MPEQYCSELTQEQKIEHTIAAICAYEDKLLVVNNTPEEYKELRSVTTSPRSSVPDGMPHAHNPRAGEAVLVAQLDALNIMKERYLRAKYMVDWFGPMWNALSDDERKLLESCKYMDTRSGYLSGLAAEIGYDVRHVRRLREKALERLVRLLF